MLYDPKWDIARVLLMAADLIERHGLAKHALTRPDGSMCLHGAIWRASSMTGGDENRATEALAGYLRSIKAQGVYYNDGCAEWNNHPKRTKEQVVSALRAAAR